MEFVNMRMKAHIQGDTELSRDYIRKYTTVQWYDVLVPLTAQWWLGGLGD